MKFRASIEQNGPTATGLEVPANVVARLGSTKHPKVRVTINGFTYRSSVASMGGRFMLGVSAKVREGAGVASGDTVDVDIELDTEPREVTVPSDLAAALKRDTNAQQVFDALSYSKKQRFVLPIEDAKTAETRERRIAKTIEALRDGRT
ncbi:MAG: YdeI/OmpD-associated family protein [Actinomycetota bacterium]